MPFLPKAAQYMLLSALGFSLMSLFVKLSADLGIPVMEILAARALVSLVLSFVTLKASGIPLLGTNKWLLTLRGFVGFLALSLGYYAVTHLPLAMATILQFLNPAFTAVLGFFILKEAVNAGTFSCIVLSICGALAITAPSLIGSMSDILVETFSLVAIAFGIGGALCSGFAYVIVKKLSKKEHPLVIVFYFPLIALPASVPFFWDEFVIPDLKGFIYLVLVGCFTQVGQVYMTKGMQLESASKATAYLYMQVVFATILGVIFLNEIPSIPTYAGAALIFIGAYINLIYKTKVKTPEQATA